jgi:hypothetical protein
LIRPEVTLDSPDLVIAKRLLDQLKLCGFQFQRAAQARMRCWWASE